MVEGNPPATEENPPAVEGNPPVVEGAEEGSPGPEPKERMGWEAFVPGEGGREGGREGGGKSIETRREKEPDTYILTEYFYHHTCC